MNILVDIFAMRRMRLKFYLLNFEVLFLNSFVEEAQFMNNKIMIPI